jgi:hypothetical protein
MAKCSPARSPDDRHRRAEEPRTGIVVALDAHDLDGDLLRLPALFMADQTGSLFADMTTFDLSLASRIRRVVHNI